MENFLKQTVNEKDVVEEQLVRTMLRFLRPFFHFFTTRVKHWKLRSQWPKSECVIFGAIFWVQSILYESFCTELLAKNGIYGELAWHHSVTSPASIKIVQLINLLIPFCERQRQWIRWIHRVHYGIQRQFFDTLKQPNMMLLNMK
jgi:hypothetical protein